MFTVPDLPYKYNALEPHIDEKTMIIHHDKHHVAYVNNLNAALEGQDDWLNMKVEDIISKIDEVPDNIRMAVRNNGGGHANHSLFWQIMSPNGGGDPEGKLLDHMNKSFGSLDAFKKEFTQAGMTRFGSGWAWLVMSSGKLSVTSTPNQDSPLMEGKTPLLGCDVWEHAYYLKYQNMRADYMNAWWNVVNWKEVSKRFEDAMR